MLDHPAPNRSQKVGEVIFSPPLILWTPPIFKLCASFQDLCTSEWMESIISDMNISIKDVITNQSSQSRTVKNILRLQDSGSIMDSPWIYMNNTLIDLKVEELAGTVDSVLDTHPGPQAKPVVAIMRGRGGGKRRALEELRRYYLQQEGVLPIAITYGLFSRSNTEVLDPKRPVGLFTALGVVARAIYATHDTNCFDTVVRNMERRMPLLHGKNMPGTFLTEAMEYLVRQVQQHRKITSFVLLIDGTTFHEECVRDVYPNPSDPFAMVQDSLLNQNLCGDVRTAVILSSLQPTAFGVAVGGRGIKQIHLPERLDTASIVRDWWLKGKDGDEFKARARSDPACKQQGHLLELCAALLNNIPMGVEIAAGIIRRCGHSNFDGQFLQRFLAEARKTILGRYKIWPSYFPSPKLYFAAIFQRAVVIDDEFLCWIERSVFTNSLPIPREEQSTGVPILSLMLLSKQIEYGSTPLHRGVVGVVDTLVNDIVAYADDPNRNVGNILRDVAFHCFKLRGLAATGVACAVDDATTNTQHPLTWADLLGFSNNYRSTDLGVAWAPLLGPIASPPFSAYINNYQFDDDFMVVHEMKESSYANSEAFKEELKGLKAPKRSPMILIKFARGQECGVGILVFVPDSKPLLVCIDFTPIDGSLSLSLSQRASDGDGDAPAESLSKGGAGFQHMRDVCGGGGGGGVDQDRIQDIPFVYIYFSTHEEQNWVSGNVMHLGRESTLPTLGPLREIVRVAQAFARNIDEQF